MASPPILFTKVFFMIPSQKSQSRPSDIDLSIFKFSISISEFTILIESSADESKKRIFFNKMSLLYIVNPPVRLRTPTCIAEVLLTTRFLIVDLLSLSDIK